MQVLIEKAKSGADTLVLSLNGKRYSVYSSRDPERDGLRYFKRFADNPGEIRIFIGLGLAHHILPFERAVKKAIERTGERGNRLGQIVVLEPDDCIYNSVKGCRSVQKLIESRTVRVYAGDAVRHFVEDIKTRYDYLFCRSIQVLSYPALKNIFREQYENLEKSIGGGLDELLSDGLTIARFSRLWINNYCRNNSIKNIRPVSALYGGFSGHVLIAGAGPSLDRVLEKLLRLEDRLFIIAVDASVKPLLKHRVRPDAIVTVDPQDTVFYHFSGLRREDIGGIHAVMSSTAYPPVFELFSEKYVFHTKHPLSGPQTGVNDDMINHRAVSSIAFELACRMGFTSIHLAGFDFSYPGYRAYARHTFFYEYAEASGTRLHTAGTVEGRLIRRNIARNVRVKADTGISTSEDAADKDTGSRERTVPSASNLDSYRMELEAIIDEMKRRKGVQVFNWDSLGREIRGAAAEEELVVSESYTKSRRADTGRLPPSILSTDIRPRDAKFDGSGNHRRIREKGAGSYCLGRGHEKAYSGFAGSDDERAKQLRMTLALRYRLFKHATGFDEAMKYADTYLCKRFGRQ